jgi:hypothetical protein
VLKNYKKLLLTKKIIKNMKNKKLTLARKMMTLKDIREGVSPYLTKNWTERKKFINFKVNKVLKVKKENKG